MEEHRAVLVGAGVGYYGDDGQWQSFVLAKQSYIIGRDSSCDIVISDAKTSALHAEMRNVGDSWEIVDNDSRNGVYVNSIRIRKLARLNHQDTIQIGRRTLFFVRLSDASQVTVMEQGGKLVPHKIDKATGSASTQNPVLPGQTSRPVAGTNVDHRHAGHATSEKAAHGTVQSAREHELQRRKESLEHDVLSLRTRLEEASGAAAAQRVRADHATEEVATWQQKASLLAVRIDQLSRQVEGQERNNKALADQLEQAEVARDKADREGQELRKKLDDIEQRVESLRRVAEEERRIYRFDLSEADTNISRLAATISEKERAIQTLNLSLYDMNLRLRQYDEIEKTLAAAQSDLEVCNERVAAQAVRNRALRDAADRQKHDYESTISQQLREIQRITRELDRLRLERQQPGLPNSSSSVSVVNNAEVQVLLPIVGKLGIAADRALRASAGKRNITEGDFDTLKEIIEQIYGYVRDIEKLWSELAR